MGKYNNKRFNKDQHRGRGRKSSEKQFSMLPPHEAGDIDQAVMTTRKSIECWQKENKSKFLKESPSISLPDVEIALDPWQTEAIAALDEGDNVIVDAPTTAGKTRIVEVFFAKRIADRNFRACYTTPVKSLSNDKLHEFIAMFGRENVGIATGDVKENLSAPIVVSTLETYRNSLLGTEPDLGRRMVVYDEYHFIQDSSRGSAWEEAVILTPPESQILLLSASVGNPGEFKTWIEKIHPRSCRLISVSERPVPLKHIIYYKENWLLENSFKLPPKNKNDQLYKFPLDQSELVKRLPPLIELNLTPCIIYAGKRLACENLAVLLAKQLRPLTEEESAPIRQALQDADENYKALSFLSSQHKTMLIQYGVGFHHSGIAHPGRIAVESLVKQGLLRFCVATMGLSIGINFSVRSALISDFVRPGDSGIVHYSSSEVMQMLGRAGRRGIDRVGFSLWPSAQGYHRMKPVGRDNCESNLRNDPTTFLGLLGRGLSLEEIERFYEKSFMRHKDSRIDLSLTTRSNLSLELNERDLPCISPISDFAGYIHRKRSLCGKCVLRKKCHAIIKSRLDGALADLHYHLHTIGCIDKDDKLTEYGSLARFFPQNGGLLFARMIFDDEITIDNLLAGVELMGCLTLAGFKEPGVRPGYRFPFPINKIREDLEKIYYPYEMFAELYEEAYGRRSYPKLREFNPKGGSILRDWLMGTSWDELRQITIHEKFGEGDLMGLLYRVGTFLQSLAQSNAPEISNCAHSLWRELMRPPLLPQLLKEEFVEEIIDDEVE